jgi:hypothetical protein
MHDRFCERTDRLKIETPVLKEIRRRNVSFVNPKLRVRARHLRGETMLRHASLTEMLS